MSKFMIVMYMCSAIAQQCIQADTPQLIFDSYKECAIHGYEYSARVLTNMSKEDVNSYRTTILFECREEATT